MKSYLLVLAFFLVAVEGFGQLVIPPPKVHPFMRDVLLSVDAADAALWTAYANAYYT